MIHRGGDRPFQPPRAVRRDPGVMSQGREHAVPDLPFHPPEPGRYDPHGRVGGGRRSCLPAGAGPGASAPPRQPDCGTRARSSASGSTAWTTLRRATAIRGSTGSQGVGRDRRECEAHRLIRGNEPAKDVIKVAGKESADFTADVPGYGDTRCFEARCHPVRSPTGRMLGVLVFVNEVVRRVPVEEALRRSQARIARLQMITTELATALTVDQVVEAIRNIARVSVGADRSQVALLDEPRGPTALGRVRKVEHQGELESTLPRLMSAAVRWRRPLYLASPRELSELFPDDADARRHVAISDERAWVVLPLIASGVPLGALRFAFHAEHTVERDDRVFLEALAGQCALAIERARLYGRERRNALELQRDLLPARLPQLPGVSVAFRYLPGSAEAEVGGDWYDVFALPCGKLAMVVGDVIGKGIAAAAGWARCAGRSARSRCRTGAPRQCWPGSTGCSRSWSRRSRSPRSCTPWSTRANTRSR